MIRSNILSYSKGDILSWTGAEGNMTFNQTRHYLYRKNAKDIIFWTRNRMHEWNKVDKSEARFTVANHFCSVLEVYPREIPYLAIEFGANESFIFIVHDPVSANSFLIPQMSGGKILYEYEDDLREEYLIKLTETVDKTDKGRCTKYPNNRDQSYNQCINDYIVEKTKSVFGFILPFFSPPNQLLKPVPRLKEHEDTLNWLTYKAMDSIGGKNYRPATCLPSCTILTATSEQQQKFSYKKRIVALLFDDVIEVQTTVIAFDLVSLLVEFGSALGLWLGLSMVGVFELFTTCFNKMGANTQYVRNKDKVFIKRPATDKQRSSEKDTQKETSRQTEN